MTGAEVIVYGFAAVGFIIVLCVALGATEVVAEGMVEDRREQAEIDTRKVIQELEIALRHARQPEHILLPAMMEVNDVAHS